MSVCHTTNCVRMLYYMSLSCFFLERKDTTSSISDFSVFVLGILTLWTQHNGVSGIQCYSCSYITNADWTLNYECVTSAANVSMGNPKTACPTDSSCFVQTVYSKGVMSVRSALRGCGKGDKPCNDRTCCDENGTYSTCWTVCDTDLCNDMDVSSKPQGSSGKNMGTCG
ncbi:hypothetical protein CHS0354_015086 [Potamilus streckersoni]|uniref:Uncharacterized protein n=1 Tax=Potamilus streckersoni TaxID=2493646 RepID=A0AAE0TGB7_9BIVA|nr:hypothetical protein CHS0354_015086 [Potamilus streckersoni]